MFDERAQSVNKLQHIALFKAEGNAALQIVEKEELRFAS